MKRLINKIVAGILIITLSVLSTVANTPKEADAAGRFKTTDTWVEGFTVYKIKYDTKKKVEYLQIEGDFKVTITPLFEKSGNLSIVE